MTISPAHIRRLQVRCLSNAEALARDGHQRAQVRRERDELTSGQGVLTPRTDGQEAHCGN